MPAPYFLGSFVFIRHATSERQQFRLRERGQVVAESPRGITVRYADGGHVETTTYDVVMEVDQQTPVWPSPPPQS